MSLRAAVIAACIGFTPALWASSGPPPAFFAAPSYIDPDYKAPHYTEIGYGPVTKFNLLLQPYMLHTKEEGEPETKPPVPDIVARAASEKNEPGNYERYIQAARAFNAQDPEGALYIFLQLRYVELPLKEKFTAFMRKPRYSWVREAATYMIARCQLVAAQKDWDGYSDPVSGASPYQNHAASPVDQQMLANADAAYLAYLKEYPQGLYAHSARNIRRKVFFLSDSQSAFNQDLRRAMNDAFFTAPTPQNLDRALLREFENTSNGTLQIDIAHDAPPLVAYAWLTVQLPMPADMAALQRREKDFATYPGLFRYTQALGLYRLHDYAGIVANTGDEPLVAGTLSRSTRLLRARALMQLGKLEDARGELVSMHRGLPEDALDLEIASLELNHGNGLWLFTKDSPLESEKSLRAIAQFGLSDSELEKGVDMPAIADAKHQYLVDELARRYLLSRRFPSMHALLAAQKTPGHFASLSAPAAILAANPQDAQALADVGGFAYEHFITPDAPFGEYDTIRWNTGNALEDMLPTCKPCSQFKARSKDYSPPMAFFESALASVRRTGGKSEGEAEALHYIVRCERLGGEYEQRCKWTSTWDSPGTHTSKQAFMRLHKLYKDSPWTQKTSYYY